MLKPTLQPIQPTQRTILTVSELNQQTKRLLETNYGAIWLTGEISNLTKAVSGHWYFSLKDNSAQISCAMFKFKTQSMSFAPNEGDKVVVKGKVSLYEARGNYQLLVDYMEPAGLGNLQQKLNQLMQKLQAEGLFETHNKKAIPQFPQKIGVITSPTGAAIHDVLHVLKRRCPMVPVIIYPAQVQGEGAVNSLINAIELAEKRDECDVILITRGGGSLEDLWSFNDETLAYKIVAMRLPIVAAIGHEVDTSITELVADLRAPTPSAAAELLVPETSSLQQKLDLLGLSMLKALNQRIDYYQIRLNTARLKLADPASTITASSYKLSGLSQSLQLHGRRRLLEKQNQLEYLKNKLFYLNPARRLKTDRQKLKELTLRLQTGYSLNLQHLKHQFQVAVRGLNALSPLLTLGRGYSITRDHASKQVISSIHQLKENQAINILMADGEADALIKSVVVKEGDG